MDTKNCLSKSYQKVDAYSGVDEVEQVLLENNFLVVFDGDRFCGILTPYDLIKHPHRLVIDCLTEKIQLESESSITHALIQFHKNRAAALPVFDNKEYIGIVEKKNVIKQLKLKLDKLSDESIISRNIKTKFLNNLSHEIRTPLNGVLGFMELISSLDLDNLKTDGMEYVDLLRESSDRFLMLMHDLVELSLVHAGETLAVKHELVRIEDIFFELEDTFRANSLNVDNGIKINFVNADSSGNMFLDGQKLKRIFFHLIENAVKYSTKNSSVTVGFCGIVNGEAGFFVTNTGSYIAEEEKSKIFDFFEKRHEDSYHHSDGLGIGLAVVKSLLNALDGSIEVINESENQTTFKFSIAVQQN